MNLLLLGMERALLDDKASIKNSAKERMLLYSKFVSKIFIVVHSPDYFNLKENRISDKVIAIPTGGSNKFTSFNNMYKIASRICDKENIDLIVTQDPFATGFVGFLLKRKYKIPFLVNVYSSFFDDPYWLRESYLNRVFNRLGKYVVKNADGVRVECETEKRKVMEIGVNEERVCVATVPIDLKRFTPTVMRNAVRQKYVDEKFKKIILYLGRLSKEKDVVTLVKAMKLVEKSNPEALLLIAGSGHEEERLKHLAKKLELKNVVFAGKVDYELVPQYYAACDVFVLPSVYEGIPLVIIEALASKRPVVCTDLRDINDIVTNEKTGLIVPKKDEKAMAKAISSLLNDPKKAMQMATAGQSYVLEMFDQEKNLSKLVEFWYKVKK